MKIRIAKEADVEYILPLCIELFNAMAELQPYQHKNGEQNKQFIIDTITNVESDIILAEEAGEVLGYVSLFEKHTPDFSFRVSHVYAYLMDIVVKKDYQRKGVASELMKQAKQWAYERNLEYIELSVLSNNKAIELYRKIGFNETVRTMICRL